MFSSAPTPHAAARLHKCKMPPRIAENLWLLLSFNLCGSCKLFGTFGPIYAGLNLPQSCYRLAGHKTLAQHSLDWQERLGCSNFGLGTSAKHAAPHRITRLHGCYAHICTDPDKISPRTGKTTAFACKNSTHVDLARYWITSSLSMLP